MYFLLCLLWLAGYGFPIYYHKERNYIAFESSGSYVLVQIVVDAVTEA